MGQRGASSLCVKSNAPPRKGVSDRTDTLFPGNHMNVDAQEIPSGKESEVSHEMGASGGRDASIEMTPSELKRSLDAGEPWRLLDVREPAEAEIVSLEGAILLDRAKALEMIQNWPRDTPIVFYCKKGIRSLEAAVYFKGQGFSHVRNLTGGIDRWTSEIDPSLPRY